MFQVHLSNSLELFKFLSLLWGYSHSLGDQLECRVGALLQTQALYMGKALLAAQSATNLNSLASDASPGTCLFVCDDQLTFSSMFIMIV